MPNTSDDKIQTVMDDSNKTTSVKCEDVSILATIISWPVLAAAVEKTNIESSPNTEETAVEDSESAATKLCKNRERL
ncbi:MAG: hypothetical protein ACLUD0_18150 [Eubacterium ramulus]